MTADKTSVPFNLPYNQSAHYWLATFFAAQPSDVIKDALQKLGMQSIAGSENACAMHIANPWIARWESLRAVLNQHNIESQVEVALIAAQNEPALQEFEFSKKSFTAFDALANSLWLGDAIINDHIVCYMQPVLDKRGKVFGYEAFARAETEKGVIGGGKIIEASRGLNIEHILDRHLHVKAITSFISSDLEGFLFVNFVPGFIHRPEKYLEGLTEAAKFHGMPAKQLVLDFTHSEVSRDPLHLKSIFDYCRSKGYSLSLDDISSTAMAKKILENIRPDFIKLDIALVRDVQGAANQHVVNELVTMAHTAGSTVLAEGVETQDVHDSLLKAGVDLFQGYLFSPPVAVSALKKAAI